jgi:hypothetical protein
MVHVTGTELLGSLVTHGETAGMASPHRDRHVVPTPTSRRVHEPPARACARIEEALRGVDVVVGIHEVRPQLYGVRAPLEHASPVEQASSTVLQAA